LGELENRWDTIKRNDVLETERNMFYFRYRTAMSAEIIEAINYVMDKTPYAEPYHGLPSDGKSVPWRTARYRRHPGVAVMIGPALPRYCCEMIKVIVQRGSWYSLSAESSIRPWIAGVNMNFDVRMYRSVRIFLLSSMVQRGHRAA
jgi:hypothetical protein